MTKITKEALRELKKVYHPGRRIMLIQMDDDQAPMIGTEGTVQGVDDTGSVMVDWDNGSSLSVIYKEDYAMPLPPYHTSVDGHDFTWQTQEEALSLLRIMMKREPEKANVYRKMREKVQMGYDKVSDEASK